MLCLFIDVDQDGDRVKWSAERQQGGWKKRMEIDARGRRSRPASEIRESLWTRFVDSDRRLTDFLERASFPLLRISLAVVFVWFGSLKVFDVSPVSELVARTLYWADPSWFVPLLGLVEVVIGLGLLAGRGLRVILPLFVAQMAGTFLVLLIQPDVAFRDGNVLLLSTEGEFVVKNLVLLSAGLAIGSKVRRPRPWRAILSGRRLEDVARQAPSPNGSERLRRPGGDAIKGEEGEARP